MAGTGKGWWDEQGSSGEVLLAVEYMNSQDLRTSTADMKVNMELISEDPEAFLSRGKEHGTSRAKVEGIEYIDEGSVGPDEFSSRFVAPGRPCMVRGCSDTWPAKEAWGSAEALSRSRGHVEIRVTERKDHASAKARPLRVPLRHYCAYAESNVSDFPWYGFDDDFTCGGREELCGDFRTPAYFVDDCYDVSEEARHVFPKNMFFIVGGARTGTGLHVDPNSTSAWNTLLSGRKRWVLFPPGSEQRYKELLGVQEEYSRKVSQPCRWWREDYKRILEESVLDGSCGAFKGMIECVQEAGETIFVPAGWWHAVLNLDFTVAITANPLLPASLHSVWKELVEACPKAFLGRFARQCAEKWPSHILADNESASQHLLALATGQEEAGEEEALPEELAEVRSLGASHPGGGVLFLDVDGSMRASGGCGDLDPGALAALQELVNATRAEVVLTSGSRAAEVSRQAVKESLNRWGIDFVRWVTTGDLPGGRSSQILEFVTKHVKEGGWAVVDSEGVGRQDGLMMEMLLHSRCVVAPLFGPRSALEAAKILLDIDDDDDE